MDVSLYTHTHTHTHTYLLLDITALKRGKEADRPLCPRFSVRLAGSLCVSVCVYVYVYEM